VWRVVRTSTRVRRSVKHTACHRPLCSITHHPTQTHLCELQEHATTAALLLVGSLRGGARQRGSAGPHAALLLHRVGRLLLRHRLLLLGQRRLLLLLGRQRLLLLLGLGCPGARLHRRDPQARCRPGDDAAGLQATCAAGACALLRGGGVTTHCGK
jgi:hypothetical protein